MLPCSAIFSNSNHRQPSLPQTPAILTITVLLLRRIQVNTDLLSFRLALSLSLVHLLPRSLTLIVMCPIVIFHLQLLLLVPGLFADLFFPLLLSLSFSSYGDPLPSVPFVAPREREREKERE